MYIELAGGEGSPAGRSIALVVDLDGTLLKTDTLHEGIAGLLAGRCLALFRLLPLLADRLALKKFVEPESLAHAAFYPERSEALAYIAGEARGGRPVWLATASPESVARACADRFGFFDGVLGSREINLKGTAKAEMLCAKFGPRGFDYMGDSLADIPVWSCARQAIVAGGSQKVIAAARAANENVRVLPARSWSVADCARALRLQQWVKNLLVFFPMILAHELSLQAFLSCLLAFFSLGLCASAIYVLNDISDLASDRQHPRKKFRPFASGALPLALAPLLCLGALAASLLLSLFLPTAFREVLGLYFAGTVSYSLVFKRKLFIDVLLLCALYLLRILAGGATLGISISNWVLSFAGFLFLGLALFKRAGRLAGLLPDAEVPRRAYMGQDRTVLEGMAVCCGFLAVAVVAFYIDSLQARSLYAHPQILWFFCPILLYWYGRLSLLAHRGEMLDDPVSFAVHDSVTWALGLLCVLVFVLAS